MLLTPVLSVVGWWALLTGYLASNVFLVLATAFIVMVAFTFSERNEAILDNIESIAEEHGYDEVCMVTGKAHVSALINEAQERGGDLEVSRAFYQQLFRHGEERQLDDIETRGGRRHVEPAMETAGNVLLRRATATMIDWVVLFALFFFLGVVFTVIRSYLGVGNETIIVPAGSASVTVGDLFWIFSIPLLLLYHPLMETRYGRSVGKYILGLVVVESDGGSLTPRSALIRWLFRPIDFLPSFYFFGALVSVLSDEGQRIGDYAAGTTVVMTRGRHDG